MENNRLSKINALVEYSPVHADRLSKVSALVEYNPVHADRLSKIVTMVEYVPVSVVGTLRHINMNGNMQNLTGGFN